MVLGLELDNWWVGWSNNEGREIVFEECGQWVHIRAKMKLGH
jgi:hypothetical protein